ncbi:MAG: polymerase, partial [Acidimicrobiaceae bacterium]|nr:polymerase [Acidimicrobiaceae bacterium]
MLLDGNSLAYRAFFALPTDMATASGQVTNAVFGFTSMLVNLLKDHQPDHIAVAFDRPEPTFRHEMVADYKAGRSEAPDILRQQMGLVRQVVETLKIPTLELAGFEADDVIATLATQARDRGDDVIIVTGDRDAYQLVEDPHVKVLYNRRGVSDYVLYDEAGIQDRTGVHPVKYPEYAALRGDPSDNLPGVPGVGEKTAAKLINDYGDLEGIFANLDKFTPKLRENLTAGEAQVRSNAKATPLVRDAPISCEIDELKMGGWDTEEVHNLFNFLEFRTLWDRLLEAVGSAAPGGAGADAAGPTATFEITVEPATADSLFNICEADEAIAVDVAWDGEPGRSAIKGLALAARAEHAYWLAVEQFADERVREALCRLFGHVSVHAHQAKELMRGLHQHDIEFTSLGIDTAVAAYLVDPAVDQYLLDVLCAKYAGIEIRSPDAPPAGQLDLAGTAVDVSEESGRRASAVLQLVDPLAAAMDARGLRNLYDEIERPLVRVLARMEI